MWGALFRCVVPASPNGFGAIFLWRSSVAREIPLWVPRGIVDQHSLDGERKGDGSPAQFVVLNTDDG